MSRPLSGSHQRDLLKLFTLVRPVWLLDEMAVELGYSRTMTLRAATALVANGDLSEHTTRGYRRTTPQSL